ncbi:MAG TPA: YegS/Rv2252/BmrU family lipid kinase [Stenomitos sp.]
MATIRVIVNRHARNGGNGGLLKRVARALQGLDYELIIPETYEDLVACARRAVEEKADKVIVVGGDGTINAVVNQLANSDVALGIIPAGTANDLATHLGIPKNVAKACAVIRRGAVREMDLVEINGRFFVTAGGMGVVSDTAVGVNKLKATEGFVSKATRSLGSLVYVLYSFGLLAGSRKIVSDLEVSVDGQSQGTIPSIALFVSNQPSIGKTVVPCPDARTDDGQLGLCLMGKRSRIGAILTVILMSMKGAHTRRKEIQLLAGKRIEIKSATRKTFIGDGEVLAHTRKLTLNVVPKALKVLS